MKSIVDALDLPEAFAGTLLILALILLIAPYLSGLDFGVLKIPSFPESQVVRACSRPACLSHRDRNGSTFSEAEYAGPWSVRQWRDGFAVLREADGDAGPRRRVHRTRDRAAHSGSLPHDGPRATVPGRDER